MIQLSLNEIMQPLQYLTVTKVKGQIEIESQCKLGVLHRITEINNSDFGNSVDGIKQAKLIRGDRPIQIY